MEEREEKSKAYPFDGLFSLTIHCIWARGHQFCSERPLLLAFFYISILLPTKRGVGGKATSTATATANEPDDCSREGRLFQAEPRLAAEAPRVYDFSYLSFDRCFGSFLSSVLAAVKKHEITTILPYLPA